MSSLGIMSNEMKLLKISKNLEEIKENSQEHKKSIIKKSPLLLSILFDYIRTNKNFISNNLFNKFLNMSGSDIDEDGEKFLFLLSQISVNTTEKKIIYYDENKLHKINYDFFLNSSNIDENLFSNVIYKIPLKFKIRDIEQGEEEEEGIHYSILYFKFYIEIINNKKFFFLIWDNEERNLFLYSEAFESIRDIDDPKNLCFGIYGILSLLLKEAFIQKPILIDIINEIGNLNIKIETQTANSHFYFFDCEFHELSQLLDSQNIEELKSNYSEELKEEYNLLGIKRGKDFFKSSTEEEIKKKAHLLSKELKIKEDEIKEKKYSLYSILDTIHEIIPPNVNINFILEGEHCLHRLATEENKLLKAYDLESFFKYFLKHSKRNNHEESGDHSLFISPLSFLFNIYGENIKKRYLSLEWNKRIFSYGLINLLKIIVDKEQKSILNEEEIKILDALTSERLKISSLIEIYNSYKYKKYFYNNIDIIEEHLQASKKLLLLSEEIINSESIKDANKSKLFINIKHTLTAYEKIQKYKI